MHVKISVIIPVYNVKDFLEECLDSVTRQSLRELEIICVDDGSTDESLNLLRAYSCRDHRVQVLAQANQGTGAASNVGLDSARGEFVCFLGADDFYADDNVLEDLYQAAVMNNALICGGSLVEYADGVRLPAPRKSTPPTIVLKEGWRQLGDGHFPFGITRFIYNLQLIKDNGLDFTTHARAQDTHWLARVLAAAKTYYLIKRDIYVYRISHKQVDWNRRRRLDLLEVDLELTRFMGEHGYPQLADYFEMKMLRDAAKFSEWRSQKGIRPGTWEFRKNWLRYLRYSLLSILRRGSQKREYQKKRDKLALLLKQARHKG